MAHFLNKKYKKKISDTDYDIISLGRKITLGGKEGTEFGKSSRDYIEMNIFNTNGTLLDSIRLNETNKYIDESGGFKINPGIIMRRNGYFSGDYEIEFKSKSNKILEKIEKIENLQKINEKKIEKNQELKKEKKSNFKIKKFKKRKSFKKKN